MHPFGGTPVCPRCSKAVYAAEQVLHCIFNSHVLQCTSCNKRLDSLTLLEHDQEPYCKNCHIRSFGTRDLRQQISLIETTWFLLRLPPLLLETHSPRCLGHSVPLPGHRVASLFRRPPFVLPSLYQPLVAEPMVHWISHPVLVPTMDLVHLSVLSSREQDHFFVQIPALPARYSRALINPPSDSSTLNVEPNMEGNDTAEEDEVQDIVEDRMSFEGDITNTQRSTSSVPRAMERAGSIPVDRPVSPLKPNSTGLVSVGGTSSLKQTATGTRYGAALGGSTASPAKTWGLGGTTPVCPRCGKNVYFAEQVSEYLSNGLDAS
ncbi:hypothetical protein J3R83DRAFT_11250 [Lanmaoa asiatica]|nr:hypothetical protein J3R83DRAFT_11250 [Lanmaoa asiatica]